MTDNRVRHLELVQAVIRRMANNSFLLKGWTVTLVVALFALAEKDSNINFALLALFPALVFWGLDAYYLRQERLFRELYETICHSHNDVPAIVPLFSLDTSTCDEGVDSWFETLWSPTILVLHGVVVGLIIGVVVTSMFVL